MAINVKEYLEQLAQTAGFSDEEKAGLLKAVTNEKFSKGLSDDILRQQDYSRNMDSLTKEKQRTTDYYSTLLNWKAEQDRLYAEATGVQPVVQNGDYLTKKDLDALEKKYQDEFTRREQVQIALLKDGMRLASQHAVEFKEPLDTEVLAKIAVDKNISLRAAYEDMTAPRRAEFTSAQRKQEIADAEARGAREFASKHKIPVDSSAREAEFGRLNFDHKTSAVQDYVPNSGQLSPTSTRNLRDSFVEAYNTAPTGTSER